MYTFKMHYMIVLLHISLNFWLKRGSKQTLKLQKIILQHHKKVIYVFHTRN
jgi:uncharacterized membrane protein